MACRFQRTNRRQYTEDSARIHKFTAQGPGLFVPVPITSPPANVYYWPYDPASEDIARAQMFSAKNGILIFTCPGEWYFNIPQPGSVAATWDYMFLPAGHETTLAVLLSQLGGLPGALDANIARIGGTAQTGLDLTALYVSLTFATPTWAAAGVASSEEIAANSARRYLYLKNASTAGNRISLGFGAAAVLDSGITLDVGESVVFNPTDGRCIAAVNLITNVAAGSRLLIQAAS